ncbi:MULTISPECIES: hypothetical protein [Streptomyces]|uniref:hypothetical protein n=1 Tax=Streptomyces TaxID=1883 RepID=UPI001C2ECF80|nr:MULTISPECIES: hypothetical protein [Streptomyces]MBV1947767.1 hypothetical protein [Streptomyces sp. BV129]BDH07932.1 hypothetical protein HEK131_51590 [Streptomyces seoulensis]
MDGQGTSVVISVVAVVISVLSLYVARRKDRRDALLRLHESLISPELQHGRRALFLMHERGAGVAELSPEDYAVVNRAFAAFDVVGLYCHKGYVSEKDILELWAVPLARMKHAGAEFLAYRDSQVAGMIPTWPRYRRLADRAEAYLRAKGVDVAGLTAPTPPVPRSRTGPS